ncbi:hypothetical protein CSKR_200960 [Clonorchis sinensis]|uniref:Uncharacterized protein n=1 Tax=Clonorchis sinensis TaxID=79923 RepID=A0A8T1MKR7_CLOSI|nr:hypothetical protein CSKR_200960 [Clonorchis sinensis]
MCCMHTLSLALFHNPEHLPHSLPQQLLFCDPPPFYTFDTNNHRPYPMFAFSRICEIIIFLNPLVITSVLVSVCFLGFCLLPYLCSYFLVCLSSDGHSSI